MRTIRINQGIFVFLLIASDAAAFLLRTEMNFLMNHLNLFPDFMIAWVKEIDTSLKQTPELVLCGIDWLAFAHIVIALLFIPVYIDPLRDKTNLVMGICACAGVFMIACACGAMRGFPFFHRVFNYSFGFIGFWPLLFVYQKTNQIKIKTPNENHYGKH